jgi:hypothetical protein
MAFLIDLFKKAVKDDSYRPTDNPVKYVDLISVKNAGSKANNPNVTTPKVSRAASDAASSTNKGGKLPS